MKAIALLWVVLLQDEGMPPPEPPPPEEKKVDPAKALSDELKAHWTKIIELCKGEKKEDLQQAIAAMEMTREEMAALFGDEKTAKAYPLYKESWKTQVLPEAAADLIARYKKSAWDDVEVVCLNVAEEKDWTADDKGVMHSLANREAKIFNVRLRLKDKKTAPFLLKCFVKTDAGWRMGLKIGRHLVEQK